MVVAELITADDETLLRWFYPHLMATAFIAIFHPFPPFVLQNASLQWGQPQEWHITKDFHHCQYVYQQYDCDISGIIRDGDE